LGLFTVSSGARADQDTLFADFTGHIQKQILTDKQLFVTAQSCTEWFYREQIPRSTTPKVEGVGFTRAPDCSRHYPGGLKAAREDFSRTQSQLSVSLTFYECALVADKNDDQQYSVRELQDLLEAFGLRYREIVPTEATLATLRSTFEQIHGTTNLDSLVSGISRLYDKGYRLTARDRMALDQIIG